MADPSLRPEGLSAPPPPRPLTPNRRLALHIPNSHPRVTSPRASPGGSPEPTAARNDGGEASSIFERDTTDKLGPSIHATIPTAPPPGEEEAQRMPQPTPPPHETTPLRGGPRQRQSCWQYFCSETTSGESSRDFLARERTYFSWLRLSTLLAIAAVALFLRLRLRTFSHGKSPSPGQEVAKAMISNGSFADALARKAIRKRLARMKRSDVFFDTASSLLSSQFVLSPLSLDDTSNEGLDTNQVFSKLLGCLFFVLAVVALLVGHIDYMRCERALERADKLLVRAEADEGGSASETRWHDAQSARKAHSGRFVHVVEIIIALAVSSTALIILITGSHR